MKNVLPLAVVASLSVACASASRVGASSAPASYNSGWSGGDSVSAHAAPSTVAPQPTSPSGGYRASATAEASAETSQPAPAATPPSLRPGLATSWGETRYSAVRHTPFERSSAQPFATAMIHYNDARLAALQASHRVATAGAQWFPVYRDAVRVSLRDERGVALPGHSTGDRMYVIGQAGQRYTILVENDSDQRFEAVVSVDGLDVINGRPASPGYRGYLIAPHASITIEGFRQSSNTVAAFRFGAVGESYAAERGDARNVGVIGVALFAENGWAPTEMDEVETRDAANPFPGPYAPPPRRVYFQ